MKYPESYLRSHDIDWFCVVNGVYIHVASAGGDITLMDRAAAYRKCCRMYIGQTPLFG